MHHRWQIPCPSKENRPMDSVKKMRVREFLSGKKVEIWRAAPVQSIFKRPEYLWPMLYSLAGPVAVACISIGGSRKVDISRQ